MTVPIAPKGEKSWFMLPQAPEQAGYYVYGNVNGVPGTGHLAQYAGANMMSMIFWVERNGRRSMIGNSALGI